ncbi:MAG: tyrosine-type recombinase/integrase [Paraglaciecola sp.]|nr:tyrosine-type recombinase/integrase [Paraglaciecola sp.]
MPKKIAPLSDTKLRTLKPQDKIYTVNDGNGLSIRVSPNSNRVWIFRYLRPISGKTNNIKLGDYPYMTLTEARELKGKYRNLITQGIDPAEWRKKQKLEEIRNKHTLNSILDEWLAIDFNRPNDKYIKNVRSQFENHILPTLGDLPLVDITRKLAIEVFSPLKKAGKDATLKDVCAHLSRIMKWCSDKGFIEFNLVTELTQHFRINKSNHLPTLKPHKMSELLSKVKNSTAKEQTKNAILFQLATLTRPSETVKAKWKDFDLVNKVWRIPATDMKMKREHAVYLNEYIIDILDKQKKLSCNGIYVFPHFSRPTEHMSASTANCALKRIGYQNTLVAHGLRSLASTTLNEIGFNRDHIEAALSHLDENPIRSIYNTADYIEGRHSLSSFWGEWLTNCSKTLNTPALPIAKYVVELNRFTAKTNTEQSSDKNYSKMRSSSIPDSQQITLG